MSESKGVQPEVAEKGGLESVRRAASWIQNRSSIRPEVALVLGSGLGELAQGVTHAVEIPYRDIPGFHSPSIPGHQGRLILGELQGVPVVLLDGRFHRYEGHSIQEVVLPTRVVIELGARVLILTNAAGGIHTRFRPGDVMLIEDHLNLTGENPLVGKNVAEWGPRFPDLSEAYSRRLREQITAVAQELGLPLQKGVYCGLSGPSYETPAEVRMLRTLGADAVGMSTVAECIAARHRGIEVLGLSCITNLAAGLSNQHLSHDEVLEFSKQGAATLRQLLTQGLVRLRPMPVSGVR
jgi:purine-nucleoside phosphorylase